MLPSSDVILVWNLAPPGIKCVQTLHSCWAGMITFTILSQHWVRSHPEGSIPFFFFSTPFFFPAQTMVPTLNFPGALFL